jgi:hypothetical protein
MAIVTLSAVLAPVITSWINNEHQLKVKQLELFENNRYKAIENFTKSTEYFYYHTTKTEAQVDFEYSISNLFIYFSIRPQK